MTCCPEMTRDSNLVLLSFRDNEALSNIPSDTEAYQK
jgi:hypothetical protein